MQQCLGSWGLKVEFRNKIYDFRFGNAGGIRSEKVVKLPLTFGKKRVDVHVLPKGGSHTPLLLSKEFLKWLGAVIDTGSNVLVCKTLNQKIKLAETERGHYAIPVLPEADARPGERAASGSRAGSRTTVTSARSVLECSNGQGVRGDHPTNDAEPQDHGGGED